MDLTIIIPSYNTKSLLDACLESVYVSLRGSETKFEIIVVDNGSTDGSIELLNKKYTQVIKILNKSNVGYGKANNQAIKKAKGEYIVLLNSDTVIVGQALDELLNEARKHPRSFVGPKLFDEDGTDQASCGPFPNIFIVFLMLHCKGDALGISRYSPSRMRQVDWVSGACLMGAKSSFVHTGLFDEDIFMYMEEIDLLYRAAKKGYTTFFTPMARVIHVGAASSAHRKKPVIQIFRGLIYFYVRHLSIIEQKGVRLLLWGKAVIAIALGRLVGNAQLVTTYEEALSMVYK